MHAASRPFAFIALALLCTYGLVIGAEPPVPRSPDPLPAQVRVEATKLAQDGQIGNYEIISQERRTLYQIQLHEIGTGTPVLATFEADGHLVSIAPIIHHGDVPEAVRAPDQKPEKELPIEPKLELGDPIQPYRPDGRDADPSSRRGRDADDHS